MKKRIVLLPLLMLVLAACGPTGTDTSSDTNTDTSTGTDTSSGTDTSTSTGTSTGTDTSTSTEVPPDEKSIGAIITEATVGKIYKTTGTVTHLNGGSLFIQDDNGDAINAYPGSTATASLVVGNVVEVTGAYKLYNLAPELDAASVTLVSATDPTPIVPEVIDTDVALTAAMGTDYTVSGKLVRLNGVTTGASASNKSTLTLGSATVVAYAGFSAGHEALSENRTQIAEAINALATSGDAFDIMGVLYSSNATGVWNLGLPTVNYIIAPEAPVEGLLATYDLSDQVRTAYRDGVNNKYTEGLFAPFLQGQIVSGGTEKLVSSSGETNVYTADQSSATTGPQFNGIKFGSSSAGGAVTLAFEAGTNVNKVVVGCAGWATPNTDTVTIGGVTKTPTQGSATATVEVVEFTFADTDSVTIATNKRIIFNYIAIYSIAAE